MRTALFALLLFIPLTLQAQPDGVPGTYKHYFSETELTVHIYLGEQFVEMLAVSDVGTCLPPGQSVIEWDGNDAIHPGGTTWTVEPQENGDMLITIPIVAADGTENGKGSFLYSPVFDIPYQECTDKQKI